MQELNDDLPDLGTSDLFAYAIDHVKEGEDSAAVLTADWDKLKYLAGAERKLCKLAKSTTDPLFVVELSPDRRFHRIKVEQGGEPFLRLVLTGLALYPELHPGHSFTAAVMLFAKTIKRLGLDDLHRSDLSFRPEQVILTTCRSLNQAVETIRVEMNSSSFEDARKLKTRNSRQVLARAYQWADDILSEHKKLCVVRVDLYYQKKFQWTSRHPEAVSLDECFEHRERFVRALPKMFADNNIRCLASAIRTEFTMRRSLHHHVLIILDGQKHQEDICYAAMAGRLWQQNITENLGDFHNVSLHVDRASDSYGIGKVDADDLKKVESFKEHVIGYLAKPDHYVKWVVPERHHLFTKTVYRRKVGKKLGRPRGGRLPLEVGCLANSPGLGPASSGVDCG